MVGEDVSDLIKKELRSGPKTSEELLAVCDRAGVSRSTFYYHLKHLVEKVCEVEEVAEKDSRGRHVKKYALAKDRAPVDEAVWFQRSSGVSGLRVGDVEVEYPPNRRLLELAAWVKHEPKGWDENNEAVKKARMALGQWPHLVPKIVGPYEDPDCYAFSWPSDLARIMDVSENTCSRFFSLKRVFDAQRVDEGRKSSGNEPVFLGAYHSPIVVGYKGFQRPVEAFAHADRVGGQLVLHKSSGVGIAVCREADGRCRVVHVESRARTLEKAWVSGLAEQLGAKKVCAVGHDSLKENERRRLLLNLRFILEQRKLAISGRYVSLIEDLWEYSYRNYSGGYALALAIATDLYLS